MSMKNIFLLGTMLGVATTALAFGGIFGGSSGGSRKAATYSGGVDSIGVHINGKSAESEPVSCEAPYVLNEENNECECPAEKQCGGSCCGADNICDTESGEPQCCSPNLNYCCPAGQTATKDDNTHTETCCSGAVFCQVQDFEGNCLVNYSFCCPEGGKVYLSSNNGMPIVYHCCLGEVFTGKGELGKGSDLCCNDGKTAKCATTDESGACSVYVCCSENAEPYWAPWQRWWCD